MGSALTLHPYRCKDNRFGDAEQEGWLEQTVSNVEAAADAAGLLLEVDPGEIEVTVEPTPTPTR